MNKIKFQNSTIPLVGDFPLKGDTLKNFILVDTNLKERQLIDFKKIKIISILPSLDTPTCQQSTIKLNEKYPKDKFDCIVISIDTPFAIQRFFNANNITNVTGLSACRNNTFAKEYGVYMQEGLLHGFTARALLVANIEGKVIHSELVEDISNHPNYSAIETVLAN